MSFSQALTIDVMKRLCGKVAGGLETNAALYVGLSTADPGETGAADAPPVGNGYARIQMDPADWVDPTAAQPTVLTNAATMTFPTATGSWGTVTHFTVYTAASGGSFLGAAALTASKAIATDDTPEFAAGACQVTLT